ncbi:MAG TPA: glycosyl hydrolase family 28-related protein [Verrucomicrobiae bacterium]|nr:glycosyl hydrolase family 28-related protein [Verrucomicrobiae bacterium]
MPAITGKKFSRIFFLPQRWLIGWLSGLAFLAAHADQFKANNLTNLELGGSWVSGVAPTGNENAIWNATVSTPANCTNTFGSAAIWGGIVVSNPAVPVYIVGNTTLTLTNGIDLGNATVNLTVDCSALNLGKNQTWTVAAGRVLTTGAAGRSGSVNSPNNGNFTVTKAGGGIWTTSGNGDNGSTGIIVNGGGVNLNKASNGGTHAIGGPGLTVNNGGVAKITGTGGDQIYDGATVTLASGATFDLNGNSETIGNLSGAGGVVDNTAAGTVAILTLGNGSPTFGGSLQNSGTGAKLGLAKSGTGTLTLSGVNSYTGGTTVSGGTVALTTSANVAMAYTNTAGGTLSVTAANATTSLPMTSLTFGTGTPILAFNLGGLRNFSVPLINDSGVLTMGGNITVNVAGVVQSGTTTLLQYSGARSGAGSFVTGTISSGATIVDDVANKRVVVSYVSPNQPRVIVPPLNTNEIVVAVATPQQYGAVGDGITDDSGAFQAAMNAVYNSGGAGGGVVFVPAGNYAFYQNISVPTGVIVHGDWKDWTKSGGGLVGTTFKVYHGAGLTNGTPFITLNNSTALRDVNIWYPNQNAAAITGYPFTIQLGGDSVVQNVALVNSYQGVVGGGDKHILRTVIGSPLYRGIALDQIFDVGHAEDIRFSPDIWSASGLSNAPAFGGPHATWMRANGTALRMLRVDGEMCMDTFISGYKVGIEANAATNGQPGAAFYSGVVSNCGAALLAQSMPGAFGLMFANFTLDGDVAISRTNTADNANALFDHCQIIGRTGPAVISTGNNWHSWMQFQSCTFSNALQLTGPGVFNVVNSTLLGSTQCVLAASATRAAFTGCTFSPSANFVNSGNVSNLLVDARAALSNTIPLVYWTNVANDSLSRNPAKTNLYVVTDTAWGANGDGVHDDTSAIQSALAAAGTNGGGIVYAPAGKYKLTDTLDVPAGVELRGAFETRHRTSSGADGKAKGTVLQPYGGQGTTNGPAAIALEADSGLRGVTISYEGQNSNCIPFPPTIQGRGGNVHIIGVCSPNPYWYVDLDTYTCTNHLLDMADGWALNTGYKVGHGSSGTILDCHCNWTYWIDNGDSQSTLPQNTQAPVLSYVSHTLEMYVLGDCTELMVKDFSIIEKTYLDCITENGQGPRVTLLNNYCDASIRGYVLDAASPASTLNAVNSPITAFNFGGYADQAQATVTVLSTTNYQGTARFTSSVQWGGNYLDFNINGGDVGIDMFHSDNGSAIGSIVNGGVFHLVNASASVSGNPVYNVTFGTNAGIAGRTNEFIGCYAYNGCGLINVAANNPVNCWNDYALATYSILDPAQPVIYSLYPDGSSLYQATSTLSFTALSSAGIANSNITVNVDGVVRTNLAFSGPATSRSVVFPGLTLNHPHTAIIALVDNSGRPASTTVNFDTFNPGSYTFEAEDFDYNGGQFFDNPQSGAYAGLSAVDGIDFHSVNSGQGGHDYRPNPPGLETEGSTDRPRQASNPGVQDYDVGFNSTGNWGNYTRTFPAGTYNIYLRAADGIGASGDSASLSAVTGGQTTTNQTTTKLGTFFVPATGDWQAYTWVPLKDGIGNLVQVTNSGSVKTLRATTDNGNYNANFYILIPAYAPPASMTLTVSNDSGGMRLVFPTQPGYGYQAQYKTNLTDAVWIPLTGAITGDGTIQSVRDPTDGGDRFYRVQIQ